MQVRGAESVESCVLGESRSAEIGSCDALGEGDDAAGGDLHLAGAAVDLRGVHGGLEQGYVFVFAVWCLRGVPAVVNSLGLAVRELGWPCAAGEDVYYFHGVEGLSGRIQ